MQYKDYYKILGVSRDATQDQIKAAYRKLARKYHPDVSKEPNAETRFKEVAEAYEVLKDADKRAAYDRLGGNWRSGQDFRPPPGWDFQFRSGGSDGMFSDFFEALFGGRGFGRRRSDRCRVGPRAQQPATPPGLERRVGAKAACRDGRRDAHASGAPVRGERPDRASRLVHRY